VERLKGVDGMGPSGRRRIYAALRDFWGLVRREGAGSALRCEIFLDFCVAGLSGLGLY